MRCILLFLFLGINSLAFGKKTHVLRIRYTVEDSHIQARWSYENDSSSFQVSSNSSTTLKQLNYLRNTLIHKLTPTDSAIRTLSRNFFGPITEQINSAEYLNFIINDTFLEYPLDLLLVEDRPLFLQKKIFYTFEELEFIPYNLPENSAGLIVRDASADPDNGCEIARKLYNYSSMHDLSDLTLSDFEKFDHYEFMLISAHGVIQNRDKGYINVNGKELLPEHISRISPSLMYFDACDLAVSKSFISALQQTGTKFVLAPIVKNQAGNSSTFTIKYFFESIKSGTEPIEALYQARINLYNKFKGTDNQQNLIWYSFPFRI